MNLIYGFTSLVKGALGLEEVDPQDSFISEKRELAQQANELEDETLALQGKIARLQEKVNKRRLSNLKTYRNPKVSKFERSVFPQDDVRFLTWDHLIGIATSKVGAARLARAQRRDVFVWFQCDYEDSTRAGKVYGFYLDEVPQDAVDPENWILVHNACSGIVELDEELFEDVPSMVSSVEIRAGDKVEQIALWMESGECRVFGKHAGHEAEPFEMEPGEYIVEVTGRHTEDTTSGMQFLTSKDRLSPWYGKHRGDQYKFEAPPGNFVESFRFFTPDRPNRIADIYTADVADTISCFEDSKLEVRAESIIILTHGTKIVLRAKATGKYLRLLEDLNLDGEGDKGKGDEMSEFIVHKCSFQGISLESVARPGNFLRLNEHTGFDCGGSAPKEQSTTFTIVHHKNNEVSFVNEVGAAGVAFSGKTDIAKVEKANSRFFCRAIKSKKQNTV